MNRTGLGLRCVIGAALLSTVAAFAQATGDAAAGPIPPAIRAAKTIFVSNAGSDSGLFPQPFSGDQTRTYTSFYKELKAARQFALVDDPSKADLVLEIRLTAPGHLTGFNPKFGEKEDQAASHLPMFRLVIYDRKSHYILWTLTQSIEYAFMQKAHDQNFDTALDALVQQFEQLTSQPEPTPQ